ncbi:hypothetical protein ACNKHQ_16185 [Shigella flexneri]
MVAQCYARPRLQPGDEIIVSVAGTTQPGAVADGRPANRREHRPATAGASPADVERTPPPVTPRSRILALGDATLLAAARISPCHHLPIGEDDSDGRRGTGPSTSRRTCRRWISNSTPSPVIMTANRHRCAVS